MVAWASLPLLRDVVDAAQLGFACVDSAGRVTYLNPRAQDMFGRTVDTDRPIELSELLVPASREQAERRLRRLQAGRVPDPPVWGAELTAVGPGGREFPVSITATVGAPEAGCSYLVWVEDASERTELLGELASALRGGGPGLAEILDALAEAVTIRDPHHHIIYANRAALDHMGFRSLEELHARPPQAIWNDYVVRGEHGQPLTMEDIPSVRLLAGRSGEPLLMQTVHRETGRINWNLLKSTLLRDEAGRPAATVTIIENVTTERVAQLRERFLARATDTLMSSLDYEETLTNVAWLAVPEIADWCAIELVDQGVRQQVVIAHSDPQKLELAERLRAYDPDELDPSRGVGRVIATGAGELHRNITDEMLVVGARDERHLALLRQVGFRSTILVPLRARGRTFGVMTLVTGDSLRSLDESDLEFAEQLASRAAIAVDNARLATERREIAETLQRSLLPDADPSIDGWEVATMYRAASGSDEVEVGGDFYDFIPTEAGWLVLLGDVTGRGVQAAALTSLVRHGARFLAKQLQSPAAMLRGLDEALREQPGLSLCSALCVRLERERMVMSSAGHPPPLIVRDDGRIREIGAPGPLLGGWPGSTWSDREVTVGADETLLMYTDGVTDTRGERGRFGPDRLSRFLAANAGESPERLLAALQAELEQFQAAGQSDDTGVVALRPVARDAPVGAGVRPLLREGPEARSR